MNDTVMRSGSRRPVLSCMYRAISIFIFISIDHDINVCRSVSLSVTIPPFSFSGGEYANPRLAGYHVMSALHLPCSHYPGTPHGARE